MEIKPITTTFGGYPNSEQTIMSCTDPQRTWYLLKENLDYQLKMRPQQTQRLSGAIHVRTDKRLAKLARQGWTVVSSYPEPFLRRVHHTLVRPQVTREEAEFLGWK